MKVLVKKVEWSLCWFESPAFFARNKGRYIAFWHFRLIKLPKRIVEAIDV